MTKFLLDIFIKNKLNNISNPYSKEAWTSMEKMLDSGKGAGTSGNAGVSLGSKFFIISGVVVVGTVITIALATTNPKEVPSQNCTPIVKEIVVPPVETEKSVATEMVVVSLPKQVDKKVLKIVNTANSTNTIQSASTEDGSIKVSTMMNSVTEESVIIIPEIANTELVNQEVKIETKIPYIVGPTENPDVRPIPAKDMFKKKRKGFFSFFGFRR
jgi:hypothetical protein